VLDVRGEHFGAKLNFKSRFEVCDLHAVSSALRTQILRVEVAPLVTFHDPVQSGGGGSFESGRVLPPIGAFASHFRFCLQEATQSPQPPLSAPSKYEEPTCCC
jgi:hypothetical protein